MDSFTVAFVNMRESSRECITWYPWCLGMEPSYGKAIPHTAQYMYSMKNSVAQWYKKRTAKTSSPLHSNMCLGNAPCAGAASGQLQVDIMYLHI